MKTAIVLSLLLITASLFSIANVSLSSPIDTGRFPGDAYYHTGQVDQLWYGSDKWAVLFDFSEYHPGDSCQFEVEEVVIFNPLEDLSNGFTVELRNYDASGQPGTLIGDASVSSTTAGWQTVTLGSNSSFDRIWVVFLYETTYNSRYISTSNPDDNYPRCDGTHSYWWEEDHDNPESSHYNSMASTGYLTEMTVGLSGMFFLQPGDTDLSLTSFVMVGETTAGSDVFPQVTIRNNNWDDYSSTQVEVSISTPASFPDEARVLQLDVGHIDGFSEVTFTSTEAYTLPLEISQFALTAEIVSQDSISSNNSRTYNFDTFAVPRSHILVENMLRTDISSIEDIWTAQTDVSMPDSSLIINCFPDISDSTWYYSASRERFNYYGFSNIPGTVVDGENKIPGYFDGVYQDSLNAAIVETGSRFGFVRLDSMKIVQDSLSGVSVNYTLVNDSAHVFTNFVSSSGLYVAVVESNLTFNGSPIPGYTMLDLVSGPLGFLIHSLTHTQPEQTESFSFNPLLINPIHDGDYNANQENLHLLMWIQNDDTHEIPWIEIFPLPNYVAGNSSEDVPPVTNLNIYPNPFRDKLTIVLPSSPNTRSNPLTTLNIYNIRGQLVKRLSTNPDGSSQKLIWNGVDNSGDSVGGGIYFLRLNSGAAKATKCLLIK